METFLIDQFTVSFRTMSIIVAACGLAMNVIALQIVLMRQRPLSSPISNNQ